MQKLPHKTPGIIGADTSDVLRHEVVFAHEPGGESAIGVEQRHPAGAGRLLSKRMGRVVGRDVIDITLAQRFDERQTIFARAQRRIHLQSHAIRVVQHRSVEEQMMRRHLAGDAHASSLGGDDPLQSFARGVMAQLALQRVCFDQVQRKLRRCDLRMRWPALFMRRCTP